MNAPRKRPQNDQEWCYWHMTDLGFSYTRRTRAVIWAARDRKCPKCEALPNKPCIHLKDFRDGIPHDQARVNKVPHDERIDWHRLLLTLRDWKW